MVRMTDVPAQVWLHGFASGPGSTKGLYVRDRLRERGAELLLPDLNLPVFRDLTVTRMLSVVSALAQEERLVLFGSSLGGYTAALWAAQHPAQVEALILLAPAFELAERWGARMPPAQLARWREEGVLAVEHYGTRRDEELAYGFLEDARSYPAYPLPRAPTLVLQGLRDETVEPQLAHEFARLMAAAGNPVRLVLLPDGHELSQDLPGLWREIDSFLQVPRPTP